MFLLALAILDDLGAILIIAVFYTDRPAAGARWLLAGAGVAVLSRSTRAVSRGWRPICSPGVFIWVCVLKSGVHATLAGVVVAHRHPARERAGAGEPSLLEQLEERLHPWVAFGILPLFAFANAGVSLAGLSLADLCEPVPLGIALGLFIGKPIGILAATWLAVASGLAPQAGRRELGAARSASACWAASASP